MDRAETFNKKGEHPDSSTQGMLVIADTKRFICGCERGRLAASELQYPQPVRIRQETVSCQ